MLAIFWKEIQHLTSFYITQLKYDNKLQFNNEKHDTRLTIVFRQMLLPSSV